MTGGLVAEERPAAPLESCLSELLGSEAIRIVAREQLKDDVQRFLIDAHGAERSLVVKWSDLASAHRTALVARRWLPAAGLEDLGAPLLALAVEPTGEGAWRVYEDVPGHPLATEAPVEREVVVAIDAMARLHTAFAEHRLLPECRLWGTDRGIQFYSANVRDAIAALHALDVERLGAGALPARAALLHRMEDLRRQEPARARVFLAAGGSETLLHGDLWPTNTLVASDGHAVRVRLIDWDEAAVGPAGFDLSTFLVRFDPADRAWILDAYRRAVDRLAGWQLAGEADLNSLFETAAYARLASLLVWSIAALERGPPEPLLERLTELVGWFDEAAPVLPAR